MLFALHKNTVEGYDGGQTEVVYLVSSVETIAAQRLPFIFTDRNASLAFAKFSSEVSELDELVDWELMEARYFTNTNDEPDRRERRMAELLVRGTVPFETLLGVATFDEPMKQRVVEILTNVGLDDVQVHARPQWYF